MPGADSRRRTARVARAGVSHPVMQPGPVVVGRALGPCIRPDTCRAAPSQADRHLPALLLQQAGEPAGAAPWRLRAGRRRRPRAAPDRRRSCRKRRADPRADRRSRGHPRLGGPSGRPCRSRLARHRRASAAAGRGPGTGWRSGPRSARRCRRGRRCRGPVPEAAARPEAEAELSISRVRQVLIYLVKLIQLSMKSIVDLRHEEGHLFLTSARSRYPDSRKRLYS